MHEVSKEIKSSHLGYIQEKVEKLIEELLENAQDKKSIFGKVDSGVFNGKEQLRKHILTNDPKVWNETIHGLIEINEVVIKDRPIGYQSNQSVKFAKDKETRFYVIILNTETSSLYYGFAYRTKY
jgi:hypothetical protein